MTSFIRDFFVATLIVKLYQQMAKNKDVKKDVSHKKKDIEAEHTNPESRHDSIETERTINTNGLRNLLIEATPLNSSADEP